MNTPIGTELKERRKKTRIQVRWPVKIYTQDGAISGEVRNITSEGVLICASEPLTLNEEYQISIMPPGHSPIGITAKVIWSDFYGLCGNNTPVCIGVCMMEISEEDRQFLDSLASLPPDLRSE